jgi:prolyl-tRNA editing enzyme YbaK/EbsC (Cys-tRNA(Pro) deacylase)
MSDFPPAVDRVRAALTAAGASPAAEGVRLLDAAARTAAQAAAQLGTTPAQIANSLVFVARDGERAGPVLVLASGGHRVDTAKVAALLGATRVERADPDTVRAATGVAIGGVPPVGHPRPLPTLVDRTLEAYDEVWAAAGHPHAVFPTTYLELVRITGGTPADLAASG